MPTLNSSQYLAVTTSSQKFTNAMDVGTQYRFSSTVDCFISVGLTGGSASAGAGSHFIKAGQAVGLKAESATEGFVHVIGEAAGKATLSVVG